MGKKSKCCCRGATGGTGATGATGASGLAIGAQPIRFYGQVLDAGILTLATDDFFSPGYSSHVTAMNVFTSGSIVPSNPSYLSFWRVPEDGVLSDLEVLVSYTASAITSEILSVTLYYATSSVSPAFAPTTVGATLTIPVNPLAGTYTASGSSTNTRQVNAGDYVAIVVQIVDVTGGDDVTEITVGGSYTFTPTA